LSTKVSPAPFSSSLLLPPILFFLSPLFFLPMKIAHILTTLEMGGAQLSTLRLIKALQENPTWEVTLIVGVDGPLRSELGNIRNLIWLPTLKRSFHGIRDLFCLFQLISLMKKNSFDVVHSHSSKPSIVGRLAALFARVPVIFHTYHGFGHDFFRKRFQQILFRWMERWLNKKSSGLIFVCDENLDRAKKLSLLHPRENFLIPDFLSFENFSQRPQNKLCHSLSNPVIVSVLSFKEQKNPLALITLCRKIVQQYPNAEFRLIGEGPLLAECKRQALSQKLNIHFMGVVLDIEKQYRAADLFIGASRFEGLSMAQLECLYFQVPMVITKAGGISEIMEHGKQGFFYNRNNLQEAFLFCDLILSGQFQYTPKQNSFFKTFESSHLIKKHQNLYRVEPFKKL